MNTHRLTRRVASGINSVMGLKKEETWRTQTLFSAVSEFLFTQKCDFEKFVNVFVCFAKPVESRDDGEAISSYKNPPKNKRPPEASSVTQWQMTASL